MGNGSEQFKQVKLVYPLGKASQAGPLLFKHLQRRGRIWEIEGLPTYNSRGAAASVRRTPEGLLYPVEGCVSYEMNGHKYDLELKLSHDQSLTLEVKTHSVAVETFEEIVAAIAPQPRTSVTRNRLSARVTSSIYRKVLERSRVVPPAETCVRKESWKLQLSKNGELEPELLILEMIEPYPPFRVKFEAIRFNNTFEISVESSVERGDEAVEFLRRLIREAEAEAPEFEQEDETEADVGRWEVNVQGYHWRGLAGMDEIIAHVRRWVELPLRNPEGFATLGIRPAKGLLLYGPPGTGKSTLAKTAANESSATFFSISPAEINSMWYGQSARNMRRLFQRMKHKARESGGVVLFIDEIDGFLRSRDHTSHEATRKVLSQLMMEIDAITADLRIVIIAATNRRQDLDSALCRPGRFDQHVEVPLPNQVGRGKILAVHLQNKPGHHRLNLERLARESEGFSGADLEQWCNEATLNAWRRRAEKLGRELAEMSPAQLQSIRVSYADFAEAKQRVAGAGSAASTRPWQANREAANEPEIPMFQTSNTLNRQPQPPDS